MNHFFNYIKCGNPAKLAQTTKVREEQFPTLGDDCRSEKCVNKASCWRFHVSDCVQMIYRWHFGFLGKLGPHEIAEKGVEMARAYFGVVSDRLAKMTADTDYSEEAAWFEPYSQALLMATFAGCTNEREQFSDFLHPALTVEKMALPHTEAALGDVLLCVAASFQSSPMPIGPLEQRLQKCRKQRPKLLFKAWQMLQSGDRAKFAANLSDSTANFAKTTAEDDHPLTAVALPESILAALAYERGWKDLSFELPIAARLVTHQSLQLN